MNAILLQRKAGEAVRIGNRVVVTVLESDERTVQLGIMAPSGVRIRREESVRRARKLPASAPVPAGSPARPAQRAKSANAVGSSA